ncbi:MAG: hypothetical protein P9L97_04685 [Candidatus Tenebribacter davisii]|nr:hypothetical protein [Candidatus Tenebribacter davisii]
MKKLFFLFVLLFITVQLFSEVILNHDQPVYQLNGQKVKLDLEVREGFSEIVKVNILYKQTGATEYNEKEMEPGSESNPQFSSIMDEFIDYTSSAEYYFEIYLTSSNKVTYPSIQPEINPFRITVNIPQDENDGFVLLSPDAFYTDLTEDFLIAISTFAISDEIDYNSIKVYFDGEDVTDNTRVFTNVITFQVSNARLGTHNYFVEAQLLDGSRIESKHWITEVTGKGFELPLDLSGKSLVSMRYMNTKQDTLDNDSDRSANFSLFFKGSHKWLKFRSKLFLTSLETSSAQAVNRFNFMLNVPHFDLTIGDYSPKMNSFLLNCKNVRGIHTKLDFKTFRLLFTHGNIKRDIDGKVIQDALVNAGAFKQVNNSLRMEFGNPQNFIWGVGFVKNKDDISSLDEMYYRDADSLLVISPKDNLLLGTDFRLSLINQRLVFGTEAAMSLYNDNIIDGAASLDDIDEDIDISIDPQDFENIFIINESMIPFKPGMANLALKSYLRLFFYRNLMNFSFSTIGSSFNSLSTNYLQKDVMIISFNDNLMLMNNRLAMNFGFNLFSDNVDDTKNNTSSSTVIFTQAMYKPNDEMYFNLNFNTSGSEDGFVPDSTDIINTASDIHSTTVSFSTGYNARYLPNVPTRFALNFSNSLNKDKLNDSFNYKRNNLTLSARTYFDQIPLVTLFSYTFTVNDNSVIQELTTLEEKSNYHSLFMRGEINLLESKLKPYIDFRYNLFSGDINSQSAQMFNLGTSYKITPNTFISADAGLKLYQDAELEYANYSRMNFKMKVSQKF